LNAGQGNQATRLSAAQGNQQRNLQAGVANQGLMRDVAMANQAAALKAGQGNQATLLSAAQGNQATDLSAQQGNQDFFLDRGRANQAADLEAQRLGDLSRQYGYTQQMTQADQELEAQRLSEAFRQSGANIGLEGLQAQMNAAKGIADTGATRNQQTMAMAQGLNQFGLQQTARDQALKDFEMQQFFDQQNHKENQISWASNILNGVPVQPEVTNQTYTNPYSQFLGLASAGLGAYNTFFGNES
jgi:hypothetical protein